MCCVNTELSCYCTCSILSFFLSYSTFRPEFLRWNKRDRLETLTQCDLRRMVSTCDVTFFKTWPTVTKLHPCTMQHVTLICDRHGALSLQLQTMPNCPLQSQRSGVIYTQTAYVTLCATIRLETDDVIWIKQRYGNFQLCTFATTVRNSLCGAVRFRAVSGYIRWIRTFADNMHTLYRYACVGKVVQYHTVLCGYLRCGQAQYHALSKSARSHTAKKVKENAKIANG